MNSSNYKAILTSLLTTRSLVTTTVMAGSAGPHQTHVEEKFLAVDVRAGSPYRRS
jgi:hypothetical protein